MAYNNRGGNMRNDGGRRSNDFGANRRSGGGGGGGGRNYYDNYNSGPMNPWEGGMVPGRSGNSGMLPNPGQGDLLSQLTSPEAQLALASNLINKLINQQQQSVPPLLNLGNMGSVGGRMSNFGNDGYGNTHNFRDRRQGRMDQRRTEPYNKSGMNRRMGPDRRNLGQGGPRNQNRTGSGPDRKTSVTKSPKKDDKDKKDEKTNGDIKSTDKESSGEIKREVVDDENEDGEKKKSGRDKSPAIPAPLLYCHVCSKNMWDEVSFLKHMKGRPHQVMMDGLNEKYKLKVDLLRHDMRIAEQQREIDLERKQRQGFQRNTYPREYCAMCDLNFFGHLISHRKNIRHQKLKAFLHPKCTHCNKEFSTRLEWDDHRLSFAHLKKVAEFRRATKPNINDDEFDIDELICPDNVNCGEMVSKELQIGEHHTEDDSNMDLKEEPLKEREDIKKEKDEEGKEGDETKDDIKEDDMPQGLDVEPNKLPKYNPSMQIGKDLVIPVSGFHCRACNRFIQGEEESQVHCRTLSHYNNYCSIIRAKARVTGRKKRGDGKVKGVKNEDDKVDEDKNEDDKMDESTGGNNKSAIADDEGNWKRRKVKEESHDDSMEVDETKKDVKKEDIQDTVWEEQDKESEQAFTDSQKTGSDKDGKEEEEEEEDASPKRKPVRGASAKRARGGRRGGK